MKNSSTSFSLAINDLTLPFSIGAIGTEVVTTRDKDQRDRMYQDLRLNGDPAERQVVKFSSCEQIFEDVNGKLELRWYQTYSLAYPKS